MTIKRAHSKPLGEVKESVESIAAEMQSQLGIRYSWEGEQLVFSGTGVKGNIMVTENEVAVTVKKSFFVPVSDSAIRGKIHEYLDEHISE